MDPQYIISATQLRKLADDSTNSWAKFIEDMAPELEIQIPQLTPIEVCRCLAEAMRMSSRTEVKEPPN